MIKKIKVKRTVIKNKTLFQVESFDKTQSFTKNIDLEKAIDFFEKEALNYRAIEVVFTDKTLYFSGDKVKTKMKKNTQPSLEHNKSKNYLISEEVPHNFLIALGIQTSSGTIKREKYAKFRQINHFLSHIQPLLKRFENQNELHVCDFACGKAYLTFALYYYLSVILKKKVVLYGIDIREDLVKKCQALADTLQFSGMQFETGSIETFSHRNIDLCVSLHACNTATDHALFQAVSCNAKAIVAAPCCQNELNAQIDPKGFSLLLKHPLLKERFSALLTDAMRLELLEQQGYDAEIVEFVDLEHTPKNMMIRAEKTAHSKGNIDEYLSVKKQFKVMPTLETLFKSDKSQ